MTWDPQADEDWVEDDGDDSDDDLMVWPSCGGGVHKDAQQCPLCHDWITPVYPSASARPMWWVLLVVALVVSLILIL